jgi:hypothetical protein
VRVLSLSTSTILNGTLLLRQTVAAVPLHMRDDAGSISEGEHRVQSHMYQS